MARRQTTIRWEPTEYLINDEIVTARELETKRQQWAAHEERCRQSRVEQQRQQTAAQLAHYR